MLNPSQFHQGELFPDTGLRDTNSDTKAGMHVRYGVEKNRDVEDFAAHGRDIRATGDPAGGHGDYHVWHERVEPTSGGFYKNEFTPLPERTKYPIPEGQMVIGPPNNPQQFGTVDRHGNVFEKARDSYRFFETYAPQIGERAEEVWSKHEKPKTLPTTAVLHTGQHADATARHDYITGPIEPTERVKIMIKDRTPYIMDGHHRLAEARGRGLATFEADVFDHDEYVDKGNPSLSVLVKRDNQRYRAEAAAVRAERQQRRRVPRKESWSA